MIYPSIIISVNLLGKLGSRVKHTTLQKYTAIISDKKVGSRAITKEILHTDRIPSKCMRKITIPSNVVKYWVEGPCPIWINIKKWKKLSSDQRINLYVSSFDEGYGVKYE